MMEIHEMKLQPEPFERIKTGEKVFEFRLNDEKRRMIKVGDKIVLRKLPDLEETLTVEAASLLSSSSFVDLFDQIKSKMMTKGKEAFVKGMRKYYTEEEERRYGVLAIGVRVISPDRPAE